MTVALVQACYIILQPESSCLAAKVLFVGLVMVTALSVTILLLVLLASDSRILSHPCIVVGLLPSTYIDRLVLLLCVYLLVVFLTGSLLDVSFLEPEIL